MNKFGVSVVPLNNGTREQPIDTDVALVMEFEPNYDPREALLIIEAAKKYSDFSAEI